MSTASRVASHPVATYLRRSRELPSAVWLTLPIAGFYLLAALHAPEGVRSGLDIWTSPLLDALGHPNATYVLAAVIAVAVASTAAWLGRAAPRRTLLLVPVVAESAAYAAGLGAGILAVMEHQHLLAVGAWYVPTSAPAGDLGAAGWGGLGGPFDVAVLASGAGLVEELVFRVGLLPATAWALHRGAGMPHGMAVGVALVLSSLAFSGAHHLAGEPYDAFVFTYRVFAGAAFAALYLTRGLAVAVWSHVLYDAYVLTLV